MDGVRVGSRLGVKCYAGSHPVEDSPLAEIKGERLERINCASQPEGGRNIVARTVPMAYQRRGRIAPKAVEQCRPVWIVGKFHGVFRNWCLFRPHLTELQMRGSTLER